VPKSAEENPPFIAEGHTFISGLFLMGRHLPFAGRVGICLKDLRFFRATDL